MMRICAAIVAALLALTVGAIAATQTPQTFSSYVNSLPSTSGPLSGSEILYLIQNGVPKKTTSSAFGIGIQGNIVANVDALGAAGNGTTDDTVIFQAALAACSSAGGGTVQMGPKQYLINSGSLTIPANCTLNGSSILPSPAGIGPTQCAPPPSSGYQILLNPAFTINVGNGNTTGPARLNGVIICNSGLTYNSSTLAPWTPPPFATLLAQVQRFYQKSFPSGTAPAQNAGLAGAVCTFNPAAAAQPSNFVQLDPAMELSPTITTFNPSATNANWRDVTAGADVTMSVDPASAKGQTGFLLAAGAQVANQGDALCAHYTADTGN